MEGVRNDPFVIVCAMKTRKCLKRGIKKHKLCEASPSVPALLTDTTRTVGTGQEKGRGRLCIIIAVVGFVK